MQALALLPPSTHYLALATASLGLLLTLLSLNISRLRLRHRVSFGDGGHKDLLLAVRAHGNTLEQALLFLVLAWAYHALPGHSGQLVSASALLFVTVRTVHAGATLARQFRLRQLTHALSVALQLALVFAIAATSIAALR
jgi:uncharacterized protein